MHDYKFVGLEKIIFSKGYQFLYNVISVYKKLLIGTVLLVTPTLLYAQRQSSIPTETAVYVEGRKYQSGSTIQVFVPGLKQNSVHIEGRISFNKNGEISPFFPYLCRNWQISYNGQTYLLQNAGPSQIKLLRSWNSGYKNGFQLDISPIYGVESFPLTVEVSYEQFADVTNSISDWRKQTVTLLLTTRY